jgi:hypothetical protein
MYNFWLFSGAVTFTIFIILWIIFYQVSVRYMESEILKEGGTLPHRRLIGAIAIHYATVLIFPANRIHRQPFVDGLAARRLSRKQDRLLGHLFIFSILINLAVISVFYFLYGSES